MTEKCKVPKPSLFTFFLLIILLTILTGCDVDDSQQINEPVISGFTDTFDQQVVNIPNCDGELPVSLSINYKDTESQNTVFKVVEWAGELVVGDPIPPFLQSQLEAKIDASLSKQYGITVEANPELLLESPPRVNIQHAVTWKVKKAHGYLDIVYSDGSARIEFSKIGNVELYDHQSVVLGCGNAEVPTETSTPIVIPKTPNPTQTLQAVFSEIDNQFQNLVKGNIAFNKPDQMKKDETATVELILSPSQSESALATQLVDQGGFVTSTAEPNVLIAPNGEIVTVETGQIEITSRMKAVLLPQDPEAFTVTEMHDNAEQVISYVETTAWRWSVTAKKEGSQTLEMVLYQLVKYEGKDYWHEVETYKANIVVEVTPLDKIRSLDWKWIAGFILLLVGSVLGILNYLNNSKKKAEEEKSVQSPKKKKK